MAGRWLLVVFVSLVVASEARQLDGVRSLVRARRAARAGAAMGVGDKKFDTKAKLAAGFGYTDAKKLVEVPKVEKPESNTALKDRIKGCLDTLKADMPVCTSKQCFYETDELKKKQHCRGVWGDASAEGEFAKLVTKELTADCDCVGKANSQCWKYAIHTYDAYFMREEPSFVVMPTNGAQVKAVLACAAQEPVIPVAVKSGGHSYAGGSVIGEEGIILFTDLMDTRTLNEGDKTITVGAGSRFVEIYKDAWNEAGKKHYLLAGGSCPTVSTGYALGGGTGPNGRKYGLGIQNVKKLKFVKFDGSEDERVVDKNKAEDKALFWALMGGGHNTFGVVTELTFNVHEYTEVEGNQFITGKFEVMKPAGEGTLSAGLQGLSNVEKDLPAEMSLYLKFFRTKDKSTPPKFFDRFIVEFDCIGCTKAKADEWKDKICKGVLGYGADKELTPDVCTPSTVEGKPDYPSFAAKHATNLQYFEAAQDNSKKGLWILYKNVMVDSFNKNLADAIEKWHLTDEKDFLPEGVRSTNVGIHFPTSGEAADAAFPWRKSTFMYTRVIVIPTTTTADDQRKIIASNDAWISAMDESQDKPLGSYSGFPDSFENEQDSAALRYFGPNYNTLAKQYNDYVGTAKNPLAYRSIFNLARRDRTKLTVG